MKRLLPLLIFILATSAAQAQTNYAPINRGREGEVLRLKDYARRGKTTVFVFGSRHCASCEALTPKLQELARSRTDLHIGTVSIDRPQAESIDWRSPISSQYRLRSVPHFKIFDDHGRLQSEGDSARKQINAMLTEDGII